jgi:hypothetical protein
MFEVQQSCSSERIEREKILNAALCQPLQALPPYACSRTVRKPVLEIISLATGNALSAMGACVPAPPLRMPPSAHAARRGSMRCAIDDTRRPQTRIHTQRAC